MIVIELTAVRYLAMLYQTSRASRATVALLQGRYVYNVSVVCGARLSQYSKVA